MSFLNRQNALGSAIFLFGFGAYVNIQYNTYLFQVRGLSPQQIGWLGAVGAVPCLFTPLLAGWLVDRSPDPRRLLTLLSLLAAATLAALPRLPGDFPSLAIGFFLMQAVLLPIPPLTTALLMRKGDSRSQAGFLALRAVGTLGFFLVSLFLSWWSTRERLPQVYLLMSLMLLLNLPFVYLLPSAPLCQDRTVPSFRQSISVLWRPILLPVYAISALAYLASGMGQTLLGNLITSPAIAGQPRDISRAWSVSTFLEMAFMFAGIPFLKRFGLKTMILVGILATAIRWIWVSQATTLGQIYASQALHGILVVGLMTGQQMCLTRLLPSHLRTSGLAAASILNGGVAGMLGAFLAGWIWETWSIQHAYAVAGAILLFSALLFWRFVPDLEGIGHDT